LVNAAELTLNAMHLISRRFPLLVIQFHRSGTGQPSVGTVHNRGNDLQVT
jgi:hypothetical protein